MLFAGCSEESLPASEAQLKIDYPATLKNYSVKSEKISFSNTTTGSTSVFAKTNDIVLPDGLYDVDYEATITYDVVDSIETQTVEGKVRGKKEGVVIKGGHTDLTIGAHLFVDNNDFIIEEVFFSGTLRTSGSSYTGDDYIKIYNNTNHTLYADGLAICESRFLTTQAYKYFPDIREDTATVWSIYVIPGSGKEHPVEPGHSLLICDTGIDHRMANSNSFDLSKADFEWYDVSSSPTSVDIDGPTVENLDKWYCYTNTYFMLHNRGFHSYVLARIPVTKEQYLKDYYYEYDYESVLPTGTYYMSGKGYKMPNSWIVDGVNCSIQSVRQWNVLPASIDAGWTHCGVIDKDPQRYFRSVRRKVEYFNADGTCHLQDTNNSTDDFNTECIASEIEKQGTAISQDGTPCSQKTYDGQIPWK